MPKELEEILSDDEIIMKKLLSMRTAALGSKVAAEVERDAREEIKKEDMDLEGVGVNDTKLLNAEKAAQFQEVVIKHLDRRIKELKK